MDEIEIARWLNGREREEARAASPGRTTTYTSAALSDSDGGWVDVAMAGDVHTGDGTNSVRMPCDPSVRAGDVVEVSVVNGSPRVTGVVGGGDRLAQAVSEAAEVAMAASAAAQEAKEAAAAANEASTKAGAAADAAAADAAALASGAVVSVATEYALGESSKSPPTSGWSTSRPTREGTQAIWVRTVTTTAGGATSTSEPACISGEDAIVVAVESSMGELFKNNSVSTSLVATIVVAGRRIVDAKTMREVFGGAARLTWRVRAGDEWVAVAEDDARLSADGFALAISASDVESKAVYGCDLDF